MAIHSAAIASFERVSQSGARVSQPNHQTSAGVQGQDRGVQGEGVEKSSFEKRQEARNMMILEANYSVSLSSKDNPNATLFKRAIDAINKELEPTLGKNAAQNAYDSGIDFSPQATADRIVGFATSFFPLYQQNHQGEESILEQQLDDFLGLVGGGVDKGFGEAKDILTGLEVFNGEVEENANSTYDLIYEGFDKFKQSVLEANDPNYQSQSASQTTTDNLQVSSAS